MLSSPSIATTADVDGYTWETMCADLPQDIERWPLSAFVQVRQIEEWCRDERNRGLNLANQEARRQFLEAKAEAKGFRHYERYFRRLGIMPRGRILEIGAGTFWLSSYLSCFPHVASVLGVELAGERIVAFRDVALELFAGACRDKITYAVGDMHAIHRHDQEFDFVVCDAVLHHADNLVALLREARRCLVPGGWFVAFREPSIPRLRLRRPIFDESTPENGSAQYYYRDGWRSAFINGRYANIRFCPFYEHHTVRGIHLPWGVQLLARQIAFLLGRLPFPKVCVAAQKPIN